MQWPTNGEVILIQPNEFGPPQWQTIKEFPNYMVSEWGEVWSKRRKGTKGRLLKPGKHMDGYPQVAPDLHTIAIHRLVAQAFIENPQMLPCVHHIDHNKTNNCAWNLEWVTNRQNLFYSGIAKTPDEAEAYQQRKIAKQLYEAGLTTADIAAVMSIDTKTVRRWTRDVPKRPRGKPLKCGLKHKDIYELYCSQRWSPKQFAKLFMFPKTSDLNRFLDRYEKQLSRIRNSDKAT